MNRINKKEIYKSKIEKELQRIVKQLASKYQPRQIILFGSWARGDFHVGSDIDLIIIKETSERFIDRIGKVLELVNSPFAIEPMVYTPQEYQRMLKENNYFLKNALLEGRVIYER